MKRQVVFLINAEMVGGAERHAAALSRGLRSRGYSASVFALRAKAERVSAAKRLRELRAFVRGRSTQIIVAVNERPTLVAALSGLRGEARVVSILHSTLPRNGFERILRLAHLPALYSMDRIVFVSERQREYWRRSGLFAKSETIRNGVDLSRFSPSVRETYRTEMRAALGFVEDEVVTVFCAALRPEKNLGQFLTSIAVLRGEGARIKGLVVGDGPCADSMRAQITSSSLDGAVSMVGMQEDVRPYLAAADFGLNCSVAIETLSLSALEMLAMGLPMAMSDIGGASEIVDQRNGVLFPPGDVDALKAAMGGFMETRRRREAGYAARARAVAEFDESTMFDRYAEVFSQLVE